MPRIGLISRRRNMRDREARRFAAVARGFFNLTLRPNPNPTPNPNPPPSTHLPTT
jgi:hypothetical protein